MNTRITGAVALVTLLASLGTSSGATEVKRSVDAHTHGTTEVEIAIESGAIAMTLHAPGSDIVGFEHAPESEADKAAVAAAINLLSQPQELFVWPEPAGCGVVGATVELEGDHDHGHGHAHGHAAEHLEFAAGYEFTCTDTSAIGSIGLMYFDAFPGAQKIEFSILSDAGAQAFSVDRGQTALAFGPGS